MKGTLIKVNEGIVFTIDERPKIGDWYYDSYFNSIKQKNKNSVFDVSVFHYKILASTFGVGLELWVKLKRADTSVVFGGKFRPLNKLDEINFNTEYHYKIEEGKVIIQP